MNKRTKNILSLMLTMAMVLSNIMPVFAEEIIDEASIFSEDEAHLDWVDIGYPELPPNDNGAGYGLPNPFFIINDSDKGDDWVFSRILNELDSDSNVLLVSYTNGYEENLAIGAVNKNAKSIRLYNEGTITASNNSPKHKININGYDGHGEEFLVNKNMFNITNEELDNLTLGELNENKGFHYYSPIPGFGVYKEGYHTYDPTTNEEFRLTLSVSMDIIHDTYNPLNENDTTPQTWIRVRYTGVEKKEVVGSEDNPVEDNKIDDTISKNYPKKITSSYGYYNLTVSMCDYVPYCKKKKEVVNNFKYLFEIRNNYGATCDNIYVKKITATKPKKNISKVTFILKTRKGSSKEEKKAMKSFKKELKKIEIRVSENSVSG